jgi:hypothetical protein
MKKTESKKSRDTVPLKRCGMDLSMNVLIFTSVNKKFPFLFEPEGHSFTSGTLFNNK